MSDRDTIVAVEGVLLSKFRRAQVQEALVLRSGFQLMRMPTGGVGVIFKHSPRDRTSVLGELERYKIRLVNDLGDDYRVELHTNDECPPWADHVHVTVKEQYGAH